MTERKEVLDRTDSPTGEKKTMHIVGLTFDQSVCGLTLKDPNPVVDDPRRPDVCVVCLDLCPPGSPQCKAIQEHWLGR